MRDGEIMARLDHLGRMVGHDVGHIGNMTSLMRTRIDAIEEVLFGSPAALMKAFILSAVNPRALRRRIDEVQNKAVSEYKVRMEQKLKRLEEERKGPMLTVVSPSGNGTNGRE